MRAVLIILAVLGLGMFVGSHVLHPPLECQLLKWQYRNDDLRSPHRYCEMAPAELRDMWDSLESHRQMLEQSIILEEDVFTERMMELSQKHRVRRDEAIVEEHIALKKLRLEMANTIAEQDDIRAALLFKKINVGMVGLATGLFALLLLGLTFVAGRLGRGGAPARFRKAIRHTDVEEWVDPDRVDATMYTLALKIKAAENELWALRPRKCSYCEALLPLEPAGMIQHVTLLKKAPTDVTNPKRIKLGQGYRCVPPEALTCNSCGHQTKL